MTGKHMMNACVGVGVGYSLPVVNDKSKEGGVLYVHVRNEVMVLHGDYLSAVRLGLGSLIDYPCKQVIAYSAVGQVLVAARAVVLAVDTAVNDYEPVGVAEICGVGEHAALVAGLRGEEAVRLVKAEILIDLSELLGRGLVGRLLNTVLKGAGVGVVDIVIAVGDEYGYARLRLEPLEPCGKRLVRLKLAVLGQVAGDKQIILPVLDRIVEHAVKSVVEQRIVDVIFLLSLKKELLPCLASVALERIGVVVDVGEYSEADGRFVCTGEHRDAGNKHGKRQYNAYRLERKLLEIHFPFFPPFLNVF